LTQASIVNPVYQLKGNFELFNWSPGVPVKLKEPSDAKGPDVEARDDGTVTGLGARSTGIPDAPDAEEFHKEADPVPVRLISNKLWYFIRDGLQQRPG
jgi:hypothetical protein